MIVTEVRPTCCSARLAPGLGGSTLAATPGVAQVAPFLVLALGVDNMFLITRAFDARWAPVPSNPREPVRMPGANADYRDALAGALAEVGPGITAAAASEVLALAVGSLT